jgi:cytochrome c556
MVRRMALTVVLLAGCVWCLALVRRADSAPSASGDGLFKPVASVNGLMTGQMLAFKQLQQSLNGKKGPDRPKAIQLTSEALAELANVNTYNGEKDDYRGWAGQLRDTALELAGEAKKKDNADEAKMKSLLAKLEATCKSCHDVYQ